MGFVRFLEYVVALVLLIGVVVFAVILGTIIPNDHGHGPFTLFAMEAVGGLIYGLILGYVFYLLLKRKILY